MPLLQSLWIQENKVDKEKRCCRAIMQYPIALEPPTVLQKQGVYLPQTVNVHAAFKELGMSLPICNVELQSAHEAKGCIEATQGPMRGTPETAESLLFIISSTHEV